MTNLATGPEARVLEGGELVHEPVAGGFNAESSHPM
jgi:hypothetical protein